MAQKPNLKKEDSNKRFMNTLIFSALFAGGLIYSGNYIASLGGGKEVPSPLDLAVVALTVGGLILVGPVYENHKQLKPIAKSLLSASLCFVLFFLFLQPSIVLSETSDFGNWLLVALGFISFITGAYTLAEGLSLLLFEVAAL